MAAAAGDPTKELLSSLVDDIKNYAGVDPLRPWLRGIRRMRQTMPPQILKQKLPRFLQRCAETFESDRRYHNDSRYLAVWIELMDYVDDVKGVLRRMEKMGIGLKRAEFYLAYAMYYEKQKKFEEAEKMYHAGVQKTLQRAPSLKLKLLNSLAEPVEDLQKSFEQLLRRMELYKKRKAKLQEVILNTGKATSKTIPSSQTKKANREGIKQEELVVERNRQRVEAKSTSQKSLSTSAFSIPNEKMNQSKPAENPSEAYASHSHPNISNNLGEPVTKRTSKSRGISDMNIDEPAQSFNEDMVIVKFVGSAIVGKSETEDACHHGLVDPTINMKEAMSAISSMFREPLEVEPIAKRRSGRNKPKTDQQESGFEVYLDDESCSDRRKCSQNLKNGNVGSKVPMNPSMHAKRELREPITKRISDQNKFEINLQESGFEVYIDDESYPDRSSCPQNLNNGNGGYKDSLKPSMQAKTELRKPSFGSFKILADDDNDEEDDDDEGNNKSFPVLAEPIDSLYASISSKSRNENRPNSKILNSVLSDETIIRKFVGSTVFGEEKVENSCHHGLIEPTLTLKEAMDDINNMFGEPLDFKGDKPKKQDKAFGGKKATEGFSILADEDFSDPEDKSSSSGTDKSNKNDELFEPTFYTKQAMADINEMFGKPFEF